MGLLIRFRSIFWCCAGGQKDTAYISQWRGASCVRLNRGDCLNWKQEAERLRFDENKSWTEIASDLKEYFPELSPYQTREKIRDYIRGTDKYKQQRQTDKVQSRIEYKSDGTIISEKFIYLRDGDELTPNKILEAHGLKPDKWEVVAYRNNFWNTQIRGGAKQISYQSRLTAKPSACRLSTAEIDEHFKQLDRQNFKPVKTKKHTGQYMAEVNISDLHLGKLCWHGDTPENYDYKIAREMYYQIIGETITRLRGMPIEYITFVWSNDYFNADTIDNTTTAGTRQDVDVRWQKMFNVGVEMLVRGVEMLGEIAPVKIFYTPSNHDEVNGYHALKYMEAWFRRDKNIEIDTDAYPRKYLLYGNTLLGYCHGDKENAKGSREKASRLASLMPLEAAQLWAQSKFREMHTAHLHSEHMINEINGVIVRRISSPSAADTYHSTHGFLGAVRKSQTFIYDKQRGLIHIINIPVM